MNDEAKKAAKKWLLARVDEELTQDQIAKLLQEFLPKGPDQVDCRPYNRAVW